MPNKRGKWRVAAALATSWLPFFLASAAWLRADFFACDVWTCTARPTPETPAASPPPTSQISNAPPPPQTDTTDDPGPLSPCRYFLYTNTHAVSVGKVVLPQKDEGFLHTQSPPTAMEFISPRADHRFSVPGFRLEWGTDGQFRTSVSYWLLCLAALLPASLFTRRMLQSRSNNSHTCQRCGYDLRATPERCPECGLTHAHG